MALIDAGDYFLVDPIYLGMVSSFIRETAMKEPTFKMGCPSICPSSFMPTNKRICNNFDGSYIPFYVCIFQKSGARFPLTAF